MSGIGLRKLDDGLRRLGLGSRIEVRPLRSPALDLDVTASGASAITSTTTSGPGLASESSPDRGLHRTGAKHRQPFGQKQRQAAPGTPSRPPRRRRSPPRPRRETGQKLDLLASQRCPHARDRPLDPGGHGSDDVEVALHETARRLSLRAPAWQDRARRAVCPFGSCAVSLVLMYFALSSPRVRPPKPTRRPAAFRTGNISRSRNRS